MILIIKKRMRLVLILALLFSCAGLCAEQNIPSDINVEADNGIEYFEDKNMCIAKGNAVATKGSTKLTSNIMKVYFSGKEKKEIQKIEADGSVVLTSPSGLLHCEHIVYTLDNELINAHGGKLTLSMSSGDVLKASEKILFYRNDNIGEAFGDVVFTSKNRVIQSPHMKALFCEADKTDKKTDTDEEKLKLDEVEAFEHVTITQEDKKSDCDYAKYSAKSGEVHLYGNVKIIDKSGTAFAQEAIYNQQKHTSYLMPGEKRGGRVKVVIHQKSLGKRQ